jgi:hypothetical protein
MCEAEFQELNNIRAFATAPGTLEGKWFAESVEHAIAWGRLFVVATGIRHDRIVEVEISDELASTPFSH